MDPKHIAIADYHYDLPKDRIATKALEPRHAAKMFTRIQGETQHFHVTDLPEVIRAIGPCHVVLNEAKVVKARMFFLPPSGMGAKVEVFYLEPADQSIESAMQATKQLKAWVKAKPAKKWKTDSTLHMGDQNQLKVKRLATMDDRILADFTWDSALSWAEILADIGAVPLPPYFNRPADEVDDNRYQTVFASVEGSVAAPTAGLHFSEELMGNLTGAQLHRLTLHVGAGTFMPVSSETMEGHPMHAETFVMPVESLLALTDGQPIIAVGTTAARTLESIYWMGVDLMQTGQASMDLEQWRPYQQAGNEPSMKDSFQALAQWAKKQQLSHVSGRTALIIAPPYRFKTLNYLMTNFHQPQSTLLLLVAAAIGPQWVSFYQEALLQGYRFLSYGDSQFLEVNRR